MHEETISQEELFESLRYDGIHQLGQVALAYLEPSGKVSVIKRAQEQPGLSILPRGNVYVMPKMIAKSSAVRGAAASPRSKELHAKPVVRMTGSPLFQLIARVLGD